MANNIDLNSYRSSNKKRKKKKSAGKAVICVLLVLVLLITGVVVYGFSLLNKINRDSNFSNDLSNMATIDKDVINIALFGVDSRKVNDFSGRSDSIMILSVHKRENTIKLVSVMRDSLVPIERDGKTTYGKINSAYALGGAALAVKTLNSIYGLDIKNYATVNFYGMADIIDAVGGIEVEITKSELTAKLGINAMIQEQCLYLKLNPEDYYLKETGLQKLNGVQAVAYARIRHAKNAMGNNNDFGRTERQRLVMKLLLNKALSTSPLKYPALISKLTPYIKTSLSNSDLTSLAAFLAKKPQMLQSRVPHNEYIIDEDYRGAGSSAVYYNYEYAGKVLRAFFYDNILPEDYFKVNGVDKTKWFTPSGNYIKDEDDEPKEDEFPSLEDGESNLEENPDGTSSEASSSIPSGDSSSDTSSTPPDSTDSTTENNSSDTPSSDTTE